MVDNRSRNDCILLREMDKQNQEYWFCFKKKKFLHNVDTFYYSVKFANDFTRESGDPAVLTLRRFFKGQYDLLDAKYKDEFVPVEINGEYLNLKRFSFANMYTICLEYPDWFDIMIAPVVPGSGNGLSSVTSEMVIQIRSYMLWMYGVHDAFLRSFAFIQALADQFDLTIQTVMENRVDYCWHSNYLAAPEKFFAPDNLYKLQVSQFKAANLHTQPVGSEGYLIDYVAMGKRSDKVFLRIYLKSKEVIEMGYKGWFFYFWLFHGLINRYDLYVYEECYKLKKWNYMDMARIKFYSEYGQDGQLKQKCRALVTESESLSPDALHQFADQLTPKVNLIVNVEYQVKRRHSKSYVLLPLRNHQDKGVCSRIYDLFDNRKLIMDYLTRDVFRMVQPSGDTNKSRRDYCGFWKALRSCRLIDVRLPPKHLKLVREYSHNLNSELVKTKAIHSIISYGFYNKGINEDGVMQDVVDLLCTLNDNDMEKSLRYKQKKSQQLNKQELLGRTTITLNNIYDIVNFDTGEIYSHHNTDFSGLQEEGE